MARFLKFQNWKFIRLQWGQRWQDFSNLNEEKLSVFNEDNNGIRLPQSFALWPSKSSRQSATDWSQMCLHALINEEFRPFIRRLPEFKFWYSATKATSIAFVCSFFEFFNIPVFWPILVMYFITLFCITMKRQIKVVTRHLQISNYSDICTLQHMIRYRYIPFTFGKPKFEVRLAGFVLFCFVFLCTVFVFNDSNIY